MPYVDYGLWVIMMYPCRSMVGEAVHVSGMGGLYETSEPPLQFCWEPKTALKSKIFKKRVAV